MSIYLGENKIAGARTAPTKTSDLENDSNFVSSNHVYTKDETYNIEQVDDLIGNLNRITTKIVTELPTENISTTIIYLIRIDATTNYTQWMYISNEWANLGSTQVNLEDYYNKTQTYSKTEVDSAVTAVGADIALKQDKTDSILTTTDKTVVGAINEIDGKFPKQNLNFYVSPTGSDETGDGTIDNPYATAQKAINVLSPISGAYQRNIRLMAGEHRGYLSVNASCNISFEAGAKLYGGINATTPYGHDAIRVVLIGTVNVEKSAETNGAAIIYAQRGTFLQFETVATHIINGVDKSKIGISALSGALITVAGNNVNLQIDNCSTAINCSYSNAHFYNISGTNNNTVFSCSGGKISYGTSTVGANTFKSVSLGGMVVNANATFSDYTLVNRDMANGANLYNLTAGIYNISGGAIPASLLNQGANSPIMAGTLQVDCINGYTSTPTNSNFCYQQHTLRTITGEVYSRAIYSQGTAGTVIDNGWTCLSSYKLISTTNTDFNSIVGNGKYYLFGAPSTFTNAPTLQGTSGTGYILEVTSSSASRILQECTILYSPNGNDRSQKFVRQLLDGVWYPWKPLTNDLISTSLSSVITFAGDFYLGINGLNTISSIGKLITIQSTFTRTSNGVLTANTDHTIGTLSAQFRPSARVFGACTITDMSGLNCASCTAYIKSNGQLGIFTPATMPAGTNLVHYAITYPIP